MVGFTKSLLAVTAAVTVVQAHPYPDSEAGTLNPSWLVKRKLYNLDNITNQDHKDKLTQGLKDAVTVAAKALEKMNDDKWKKRLDYWFGDKNSDDDARTKIQGVLKNFVGKNTDGTGSDDNGKVFVLTDDYWKPTQKEIPFADGKTPFCSLEKDGKTGTAYFKVDDKKRPAMHYCDKVWPREDLKALTANKCSKLGDKVSTVLWAKNFIGANVLHEYMHFDDIGKKSVGASIRDYAYDAMKCRELAVDKNEAKRALTIRNADTYVWFVLEIAFSEICGKSFSGPRDARDDDATNQDWPDSNPPTINPNGPICVCNENGCDPDSPPCCANGSCKG